MDSLIWIVEDDEEISELIGATVSSAGYRFRAFYDGEVFFAQSCDEPLPDLILLDVMLPKHSGYDIMTQLSSSEKLRDIPVIFLTAKGGELDKVRGLELGADDYITKPFGVLELLARIKSVLRRAERGSTVANEHNSVKLKQLEIDFDSRELHVRGHPVSLTYKEFELLELLLRNRGIVLSRDRILEEVWGYEYSGENSRTVDMHIKSLRQKLGDSTSNSEYIATVRGYGYKFIKE